MKHRTYAVCYQQVMRSTFTEVGWVLKNTQKRKPYNTVLIHIQIQGRYTILNAWDMLSVIWNDTALLSCISFVFFVV